ncbi:MAG: hypothetical protein Q8L21_00380 [Candidatus Komeilibacteria bacterium]|nr:hypothetical protein [Candidatus Komeilibacteria bacterium]
MDVNVRIDSQGRSACRIGTGAQVAPDFATAQVRAFRTNGTEPIVLSVSVSPEKDVTSLFRVADFEGHLVHIRPKHLDGNGVATFAPFTNGNFAVVVERQSSEFGWVVIRKIGVRRQPDGCWVVIQRHCDIVINFFANSSPEAVAEELARLGGHGAEPGDHLRKFAPAVADMWQELIQ